MAFPCTDDDSDVDDYEFRNVRVSLHVVQMRFWRRKRASEEEFLRYIMRITLNGYELKMQPPKQRDPTVDRVLKLVQELNDDSRKTG